MFWEGEVMLEVDFGGDTPEGRSAPPSIALVTKTEGNLRACSRFPGRRISRRQELCLPAHGGSKLLRHLPGPLSMAYPRQSRDCVERQVHTEARRIIAGLVERIPPS